MHGGSKFICWFIHVTRTSWAQGAYYMYAAEPPMGCACGGADPHKEGVARHHNDTDFFQPPGPSPTAKQ